MSTSRSFLVLMLVLLAGLTSAHAADDHSYVVIEPFSIQDVAVILYGNEEKWSDIAKWNQLKPPYRVTPGQKLRLEDEPLLAEEGRQKLIERWRSQREGNSMYQVRPTKQQIVTKVAEDSAAKVNTPKARKAATAQKLLNQGKEALKKGDLVTATQLSKKTRAIDPANLTAWLMEIHALRNAGKKLEAKQSIQSLIKAHPETAELPHLKALQKE